uniref:Predicted protein n=1 Tax=Hordeum vulgare subsp. vulgare TaxID=112509 RepID=F2DYU7_HORVV|nr:predicted protein [Hordeum vulgare subsp. vulgare]
MSEQKEEAVKVGGENPEEGGENENPEEEAKVDFKPLVQLKEVDVQSGEEDEDVLFKMRAKLFRFDKPQGKDKDAPGQWKERGTGDVKFLQHKESKKIRLLMRREKTYKLCANHFIYPELKLEPNVGSDRSWVWSCPMDYAEEPATPELFAIRFANVENATLFKQEFKKAQKLNDGKEATEEKKDEKKEDKPIEKDLEKLSVKEDEKKSE